MNIMENETVFTITLTSDQQAVLVKCFHAEAATKQAAMHEYAKAEKVDVMVTYSKQFINDAIEDKGKWADERAEKAFAEAWKFAKLAGVDEKAFRALMGMPELKPEIPAGSNETKTEVVNLGSNPVDVAAALKLEADKLEAQQLADAAEVERIKAKKAAAK